MQQQAPTVTADQRRGWSLSDFLLGEIIGEGRYGRVVHGIMKRRRGAPNTPTATPDTDTSSSLFCNIQRPPLKRQSNAGENITPSRHVAIKIMDKTTLIRLKKTQAALRERKILSSLSALSDDHGQRAKCTNEAADCSSKSNSNAVGFVPRLLMSFVDTHSLYIVTELGDGGTLADLVQFHHHTKKSETESRNIETADCNYFRYLSAELLCALEFLHCQGYVHRDLKPCNILVLSNGHCQLADFGSAINVHQLENEGRQKDRSCIINNDFVGTADWVAPETLRGNTGGKGCDPFSGPKPHALDLWSYGCIIHYLFAARSPFHAASDHLALLSVLDSEHIKIDDDVPSDAEHITKSLLKHDAAERLGYRDILIVEKQFTWWKYVSIRKQDYFSTVDWSGIDDGSTSPPGVPPRPAWVERYNNGETALKDGALVHDSLEWMS